VKGILFCCQCVAPGMIRRRSGKIVNIASAAGFGGNSDWSAYCASKAAAISLTLGIADALASHHVQVHAVCPGATETPMLDYIRQEEPGRAGAARAVMGRGASTEPPPRRPRAQVDMR